MTGFINFSAAAFALLLLTSCSLLEQDSQELFYQAEEALASGRIQEASRLYGLFLQKESDSPNRITAWERMLLIHLDMGRDVERGLSILMAMSEEYEKEKDRLWSIYMRIGRLYIHEKNFGTGAEVLERAVSIAWDEDRLVRSYELLAEAYCRKRDYPGCLSILYEALQAIPDSMSGHRGRIYYLLGKVYFEQDNPEMAVHYLELALSSEAEVNLLSKAGILLLDVYQGGDENQKAQAVLDRLIKIYPNPMVIRMRIE